MTTKCCILFHYSAPFTGSLVNFIAWLGLAIKYKRFPTYAHVSLLLYDDEIGYAEALFSDEHCRNLLEADMGTDGFGFMPANLADSYPSTPVLLDVADPDALFDRLVTYGITAKAGISWTSFIRGWLGLPYEDSWCTDFVQEMIEPETGLKPVRGMSPDELFELLTR